MKESPATVLARVIRSMSDDNLDKGIANTVFNLEKPVVPPETYLFTQLAALRAERARRDVEGWGGKSV